MALVGPLIEQEPVYVEIGEARIAAWCNGRQKIEQVPTWPASALS